MINSTNIKAVLNSSVGVDIVAATKSRTIDQINALKQFGITKAGENRVQEFLQKYDFVDGIEWHFIGNLQTNKVKYIVDKVKMIQSVDRESLAKEIDNQCSKKGVKMDVLIEVNVGEDQKGGVDLSQTQILADYICSLKNLSLKGLMCIPPQNAHDDIYIKIKQTFDLLKDKYDLKILSLGMSDDYQKAIKFGANMIRPGSILF